jgi:anti-anti-sigma factor
VIPRGAIEVEIHSEETAIVTLHGEHDMASTAEVAVTLAIAAGCPGIVVDASDSTFIDSTVISALLRAARLARKREGVLEVVVPTGSSARRGLELAGVDKLLTFHETRAAGVASVEASAHERHTDSAPDRRTVRAKIQDLQARTDAGRAHIAATRSGVVIIRAQVAGDPRPATRHRPIS